MPIRIPLPGETPILHRRRRSKAKVKVKHEWPPHDFRWFIGHARRVRERKRRKAELLSRANALLLQVDALMTQAEAIRPKAKGTARRALLAALFKYLSEAQHKLNEAINGKGKEASS